MSSREHNKRVAVEYFDAFVKGDKAWWTANVSPAFRRHDSGLPYTVVGPAGLQHHHDVLLAGVPDLNLPIHTILEDDDRVLVCLRFRGTHKGELFGLAPTSGPIDVEVFDLFRLEGGKLVEHWAMVDSLSLMKQLGAKSL
jgi:predicted ester cyclase